MKNNNYQENLFIKMPQDLKISVVAALKKKIINRISAGKSDEIVFDFSDVSAMDTGGLALIIFIMEKYGEKKILKFVDISDNIKYIFYLDERTSKILL